MNTNLNGKLAFVTGAETGLGEQIALRLANNGADIIIQYLFDSRRAEQVAQKIRDMGHTAHLIRADFSSAEAVSNMLHTVKKLGHIDVLVNNAGALLQRLHFLDQDALNDALWERSFQINYMSVVRTMREFIPDMCEKGWGRIINISSVSCRIRSRFGATVHYSPMKSAVETLTVHVSGEIAKFGVTCNCVAPGNMRTPLVDHAPLPDKNVLNLYHVQRNASPNEVAATVEYLASPDASFITGEVIYTSGGR